MAKAVRATKRTLDAIRTADSLKRDMTRPSKKRTSPPSGGSGSRVLWCVVISSTDVNNYVCDVYSSRGSFINGDDAIADGVDVRVPDIVDVLESGDGFPVTTSVIEDVDYECFQQIGAIG